MVWKDVNSLLLQAVEADLTDVAKILLEDFGAETTALSKVSYI